MRSYVCAIIGALLPAWHGANECAVDWTAQHGGQMAGTLPLLAGFLDGAPYDHSPYAPASRLAWNELYIDIEASPELKVSMPLSVPLALVT